VTAGKIRVREKATGQEIEVWPVDASELLSSGEYEAADGPAAQVAQGKPAFPLTGKARATVPKEAPAPNPEQAVPVVVVDATPEDTKPAAKKPVAKKKKP